MGLYSPLAKLEWLLWHLRLGRVLGHHNMLGSNTAWPNLGAQTMNLSNDRTNREENVSRKSDPSTKTPRMAERRPTWYFSGRCWVLDASFVKVVLLRACRIYFGPISNLFRRISLYFALFRLISLYFGLRRLMEPLRAHFAHVAQFRSVSLMSLMIVS